MVKGKLHEENSILMRQFVGNSENPDNQEEIELSVLFDYTPCVYYRGRYFTWGWQSLVSEAVELIDRELENKVNENKN